MDLRVALLLPLAGACRSSCEPGYSGGTAEQRAEAKESVDLFLDLLRPDLAVCVPEVRIEELTEAAGLYDSFTRRITLEATSPGVVFHELCHALDFQNGLDTTSYIAWPDTTWALDLGEEGDRPWQTFADVCAVGPTVAQLVGEPCPGDPVGMWIYPEVAGLFVGPSTELIDLDTVVEFVPTVVRPTEAALLGQARLVEGVGLVVELDGERLALDPWTGEDVRTEEAGEPVGSFAWTEQVELGWTAFETLDGEIGTRRTLFQEGRQIPLGCRTDDERAFSWDGRAWTARVVEGSLEVGYWLVH